MLLVKASKTTQMPRSAQTEPGPDLLNAVKAAFVRRGTTFNAWCREHAVHRGNANVALLGGWRGPGAKKLVKRIIKAARLNPDHKEAA